MPDLNKPTIDSLMATIDDLVRRVRRLEGSNSLVGVVPAGQSIKVIDPADGSNLVTLGELSGGSLGAEFRDAAGVLVAQIGQLPAGTGIMVGNAPTSASGDTWLLTRADGMVFPWIAHAWCKANDNVIVTSGTFVTTWQLLTELAVGDQIKTRVTVSCPVGTTAEFKLEHAGSGATTSTISVASGASVQQEFKWDLGSNAPAGTGPHTFNLLVRRTGGAGNVLSYVPFELVNSADLGGTGTGV